MLPFRQHVFRPQQNMQCTDFIMFIGRDQVPAPSGSAQAWAVAVCRMLISFPELTCCLIVVVSAAARGGGIALVLKPCGGPLYHTCLPRPSTPRRTRYIYP